MASVASSVVELFKHNLWANLRLIDACAKLNDEQLDASAPGTYGRVRDTMVHIVGAEERYAALLTGQQPENPLGPGSGFPGFAELRERARRSGEQLIAVAPQIEPTKVLQGTRGGQPFAIKAVVPVLQAINHATEHRAHVVTILSQQGIEPPVLDGWAYGREVLS